MKQLTVFEMEAISGGYSWDFSSIQSSITSLVSNGVEAVVSAATMGTLAAVFGTFVGGTQAGQMAASWDLASLVTSSGCL